MIPAAANQPYSSTSLPNTLARYYEMAGKNDLAKEVAQLAPEDESGQDRVSNLIAETEVSFREGQFQTAARTLGEFSSHQQNLEERRDQRAMQLTCRLVKLKKTAELFDFILALKDDALMDDCFDMAAALSVKHGIAVELWDQHEKSSLTPTQRVAFYSGLITGIVAVDNQNGAKSVAAVEE